MNNTVRCLVVDDEPLAARLISSYVERTPFLSLVAEVHNAEDALRLLDENPDINLLFLDIRMPRLSGMQLARLLPQGLKIVFTTAYADHAVDGFRVGAVDYLLKPVSYEEFLEAATRVRDAVALERRASEQAGCVGRGSMSFLMVKSEYRLLRLPLDRILYIEGLKDYVKICLEDENKPVLTLMSMKALEETLPAPGFMRVHRSFIVNTDKVRLIERNTIILDDKCIPVGESYRRNFYSVLEGS
ncbi:MAG: LytTR family DNA-binding domain-containing protein [Muribaculaceae bacterium]|nr:LytTR family DNA-binding domain-containing protein [Muribaculaceae bacterium]